MNIYLLALSIPHTVGSVFAFAAMICFFNVNSAWADKIGQPKGNRIFTWVGILFAAVTAVCFFLLATKSPGGG